MTTAPELAICNDYGALDDHCIFGAAIGLGIVLVYLIGKMFCLRQQSRSANIKQPAAQKQQQKPQQQKQQGASSVNVKKKQSSGGSGGDSKATTSGTVSQKTN